MSNICCKVEKCHYNENESCTAKKIEVSNCNCHQAEHIDQTECATFKVKDK